LPDGDRVIIQGPDKSAAPISRPSLIPGFPTEMQAQFMALMSVAEGLSVITEKHL
jgi:UDP-N-acetylglucosamine 1-carboxyvinyltransferase